MKKAVVPVICAVTGVAGFVGGFIFAKSKYKKMYEEKADAEIAKFIKKDQKMNDEGTPVDTKKAEEIVKDSPETAELWSKSFKEKQERHKEYKNILRTAEYVDDDTIEADSTLIKEANEEYDRNLYREQKEEFERKLDLFSEDAGISKSELLSEEVRVLESHEFWANPDAERINYDEYLWSPKTKELRDVNGEPIVPEILLGRNFQDILRDVEASPVEATYIYDGRIDEYFTIELENTK